MTFPPQLHGIVILSLLCFTANALPHPGSPWRQRSRTLEDSSPRELSSFHPPSTYKTFGSGIEHPLSARDNPDPKDASIAFIESHLRVTSSSVSYRTGFRGETAQHTYLQQIHGGIPIANAVANLAFNHDNKVVAFGTSFVNPKRIASSTPTISLEKAISTAELALSGTYNGRPAAMQYIYKEDGSLVLTHTMQIQNMTAGIWYDAFVDAHSGELVHVTDFSAKASYLVLPINKQVLTQGFEVLVDPFDETASPFGWHSNGETDFTSTSGNNAVVYKDTTTTSVTNSSSKGLDFIYKQDPSASPTTQTNIDAARTNAFYIVNTVHDFLYRYGFTESAYNFQSNNFNKGGMENDPVNVSIQSSAGLDNADFFTPPDGQPGVMRMFLWDYTQPERDGALENDIVTHEAIHGLTNRMTGGGTGACLQTTEARGLGEGWSDAVAEWTEHDSSAVPDYVMGQYVANWAPGLRSRPYSTDLTINPLKYSSLRGRTEPHGVGEVWANTLHNVYAALVSAYGWSATARTNPTGSEGNIVFLHLLIDALALQPCNPTFLDARDAWIQADANRYHGANRCLLWKVFASRGMGVSAADLQDSFSTPDDC